MWGIGQSRQEAKASPLSQIPVVHILSGELCGFPEEA
jgi:hypothetical protein